MLSPIALSHIHSPRNCEPIEGASHYGQAGIPGDGPYVQLWLDVEDGLIKRTGYQCAGCFSSIACAGMAAEVLIGRTLEQASKLEPNDLILLLQGLPEGKEDCAERTVCAVRDALKIGEN